MAWSLAIPLWSTPDAPAHDLMAWHVGHGNFEPELSDEFSSGVTSNAITPVPQGLVSRAASATCLTVKPFNAACIVPPTDDGTPYDFVNPAGRNMPTYYLATGWPSALVSPSDAIGANRVAATALASLFVAIGIAAARTMARPGIAVTGVLLTLTPMVVYLGGVVNPNSLEITAAVALAACSVAFWRQPDTWLGRAMFRRAMLAATVMVTIRMLAPVWVIVGGLALVALADRRVWRAVRDRRVWPWMALPVAGALFDVWWTAHTKLLEIQAADKFDLSWGTRLVRARKWIDDTTLIQQVGSFGWLDLNLPPEQFTVYVWTSLFVLSTALVVLSRRQLLVVGGLVLASYVVPVVLQAYQWNTTGGVWQGRYTLPLTVMVPVFALFLASERLDGDRAWLRRRFSVLWTVALAVLAVGQLRAFLFVLKRNVSGAFTNSYRPENYFDGPWDPPLPGAVLTAALAAVLVVGLVAYWRMNVRPAEPRR